MRGYFALQLLPETGSDLGHAQRVGAEVEKVDLQADCVESQRVLPKLGDYSLRVPCRAPVTLAVSPIASTLGAGNALRSVLPLGVSGIALKKLMTAGIM